MISEGTYGKFSFYRTEMTEINYVLQYIQIENIFYKFWSNKCSLGEHETSFKNCWKILL